MPPFHASHAAGVSEQEARRSLNCEQRLREGVSPEATHFIIKRVS